MMRTPATAPTLEMTFRGHRQGILAVDIQPTQTTKQSSYTRREGATSARKPSSPSTAPPPKILSGGADGAVLLWDASPTTRALRFLGHRGPINTVAFSTKTSIVASGGQDGYARLWLPNLRRSTSSFPSTMSSQIDSSDEEHCCAWRAHGGATRAMAFANDGSDHLFTAGDDKAVKMWDLNHLSLGRGVGGDGHTNRFVGSFSAPSGVRGGGHTNWVRCIAVPAARVASSYQHLVASGGDDQCVHVWDIRTRQVAHTFYDATGSVQAMAFHPDGYSVAAGDAGGSINVYDLRSGYGTSSSTNNNSSNMRMPRYGLIQHYANAHLGGVNCIDIDPSGGWLLSAGQDGALRLWDINEGFLFCTMEGHDGAVRSCRISDDGRFFASGGRDKVVMLWRSGLVERSQASRVTKASSGVARISATPAEESQRRLHAGSVAPAPPRTSSLPQPTPVGLPPMMKAGTPPRGAHVDVWAAGRSRSFERSEERLEPQGRSTSAGSSSANAADHPNNNNNVLFAVRDDDIALIQQQQQQQLLEEEREQEMLVSRERAYQQQQQQEQESSGSIHRLEALETALTTLSQYIRDQQHAQRDELHSLRSDMQVLEAARSKEIDSMHALLKHLAEMRAPGLMSTTTDDATTAEC